MNILDCVLALAGLISLVFVAFQILLLRRQIRKDHERSRRETVIKLQTLWVEQLKIKDVSRILFKLKPEVSNKIWDHKLIEIDKECTTLICYLFDCNESDLIIEHNKIILRDQQLMKFKDSLINYLNLLEVIFTAWVNQVGDRDMIEREFGQNISDDNKTFILDNVINSDNYYPSIKVFSKYLRDKEVKEYNSKKAL